MGDKRSLFNIIVYNFGLAAKKSAGHVSEQRYIVSKAVY